MKCPICHFENSDDSKFCCGCGKTIPRCPTCGKALTTRDRFCVHDGTRLPEELLLLIPEEEDTVEQVDVGAPSAPVVMRSLEDTVQVPVKNVPKAYCLGCGSPVIQGEDYCAGCRSEMKKAQPMCASCGMPCEPGEDYCAYCRPTEPVSVTNMDYVPPVNRRRPENKKKKKKGSVLTVILAILLLLLIGAAAVLVAAEFDLIDLPDIFTSEDSDRDRDKDRDSDDEDIDGSEDTPADDNTGDPTQNGGSDATTGAVPPETTAPTTPPATAATEPTTQPTQPAQTKLEYFMENCDSMVFAKEDIAGFTKEEARYARNACYAQGGRKFKDQALQAYFEQYDWYTPTYEPAYFSEHESDLMNYYMKENLKVIRAYEKEMGFG